MSKRTRIVFTFVQPAVWARVLVDALLWAGVMVGVRKSGLRLQSRKDSLDGQQG